MTDPRLIWALLIAAQLIVNLPFLFALIIHRSTTMTVSPAAQAIIDSLTTARGQLPALTAAAAQEAEDLAAIKAAADPLVADIATAALPPVTEPAPQ